MVVARSLARSLARSHARTLVRFFVRRLVRLVVPLRSLRERRKQATPSANGHRFCLPRDRHSSTGDKRMREIVWVAIPLLFSSLLYSFLLFSSLLYSSILSRSLFLPPLRTVRTVPKTSVHLLSRKESALARARRNGERGSVWVGGCVRARAHARSRKVA